MKVGFKKDKKAAAKFREHLKNDLIVCTWLRQCGKKAIDMLSRCKIAKLRINRVLDDFEYSSDLTSAELTSDTRKFIQQRKDFMSWALQYVHIQHVYVDEVDFLSRCTNFVSEQETLCENFWGNNINRGTNRETTVATGAAAY